MKQTLLWSVIVLLCTLGSVAPAQEYELVGLGTQVSGFADVAIQSKYLWRGFNWFGSGAAWQLTGGVSLPEIGLGGLVSGHLPLSSGHTLRERWDWSLYYGNSIGEGSPFKMSFRLGYVYYNHPKLSSSQNDMQEGHVLLAFPNLTGVRGLIPSYVGIYMSPAKSGSLINTRGYAKGLLHVINLDYVFSVPGMLPEVPEQLCKFHSEITYNGGVNPIDGMPVKSGWSHAILGGATDFQLGAGFTLTPSIFYQLSFEETVNDSNQFWGTLGLRYSF